MIHLQPTRSRQLTIVNWTFLPKVTKKTLGRNKFPSLEVVIEKSREARLLNMGDSPYITG